jgi:hypothetical protein
MSQAVPEDQSLSRPRDPSWTVQPSAEAVLRRFVDDALDANDAAADYAQALLDGSAVRMRDVIDYVETTDTGLQSALKQAGWQDDEGVFRHPEGYFPEFLPSSRNIVWFRAEDIDAFAKATGIALDIEGPRHGPLRRAIAFEGSPAFGVVQRSGHIGFELPLPAEEKIRAARIHRQAFGARRRQFSSVAEGLEHTLALVKAAVADIGPHWACDLWLRAERAYWMSRCDAGRHQWRRQHHVGIGWANIDHHTYDGSREHFRKTIEILETLGYELREMLYAGELAGWGSQVLEQPALKSTIFADVDLAPEELAIDFAHEMLPPLDKHRRAGVLSILHGESILEAGLNHVAALYDQALLRDQLSKVGISMMPPFSDFEHLYQELTLGQRVPVDPARVDKLQQEGHLPPDEAEDIRLNGAIATHLENIERNDGYKGFNKAGIDGVLRKLDPRAYGKNKDVTSGAAR